MKKKLIGISSVFLILFLSGCTNGPIASGCSDEGLAIVDYNVNPLAKLYPGDVIAITFWLENKGSYDANNVVIKFFDIPGFEVDSIKCDGVNFGGDECTISKIETDEGCFGDRKMVEAHLRVLPDTVKETVSFSVEYDYHGYSRLSFNIWERGTQTQRGNKDKSDTFGPVKVDIDSEFLLKRIVNDRTETITEWVEEGQRFMLKVDVRDVGGSQYKSGGEITTNNFKIGLDYITPVGECNFTSSGFLKENVEYPTKEPLKCDVKVKNINQEFENGNIGVDYGYKYTIVKQQEFTVTT